MVIDRRSLFGMQVSHAADAVVQARREAGAALPCWRQIEPARECAYGRRTDHPAPTAAGQAARPLGSTRSLTFYPDTEHGEHLPLTANDSAPGAKPSRSDTLRRWDPVREGREKDKPGF
jgi:hypothetical protein